MNKQVVIHTPTGEYCLEDIYAMAGSITNGKMTKWYDKHDIANELVVLLLEGNTLHQSYRRVKKKYEKQVHTISLESAPVSSLIDHRTEEQNVRELTKEQKRDMVEMFQHSLEILPTQDQAVMLLKAYGYKDKDIAELFHITHTNVRVKIHRSIKELRSHG